jgi:O-antigen/teichoic acid export membrane protein
MIFSRLLERLHKKKSRVVLVLRHFGVDLPEGRSKERYRKVLLTAITGPLTSGCGFLTFLITVPLTIQYLGPERYGAWMSLSALMAFLKFSDLGLGNGLVGAISQAEGRDDRLYIQQAISSTLVCLLISGAFILVVFPISSLFIHWDYVLGLSSLKDRNEIQIAIQIFVALYAVGIPVNMVQQVQRALQQGYISNLWVTLGNLFSLFGVYIAATNHASIPWLVAIIGGAPLMPALANGFVLYYVQRPDLRPSLRGYKKEIARTLLRKGMLFFGLGIAGALAFDSQNIVIAHILGPAAVGVFVLVQRLFLMVSVIVGYITAPMWPAFGEAIGRQEWPWIAQALKRVITANAVIATGLALLLSVLSGPILLHWTHGAIYAPIWLIVGFAVWTVTSAVTSPICMLLNAAHVLWFQLIISLLYGLLTIGSIIWTLPSMGLPGAVWSMTLLFLAVTLCPYLIYIKFFFFPTMTS